MKRYVKSNNFFDYDKIKEAMSFLDSIDYGKVVLVKECRGHILDLYTVPADTYNIDQPTGQQKSEIIRDYKSIAAEEWKDCSADEVDMLFDDILSALDTINVDEASAWT